METKYSKGRDIGELVTLIVLGAILVLFKLVQPLGWTTVLPVQWVGFADEIQYAAITFCLITVIVCHLIFGADFKEMGMTRFKENIPMLALNLLYVVGCMGMTYFMAQMSKVLDFKGVEITLAIISNFVAVAFVREVIFRGFLLGRVDDLLGRKGMMTGLLSSILVSILFAAMYLPEIAMALPVFSGVALVKALLYPFLLSVYLGVLYYLTHNIWLGVAVHGVILSLGNLSADFLTGFFYGAYFCVMGIYLLVYLIKRHRQPAIEEEPILAEEDMIISKADEILQETPLEEPCVFRGDEEPQDEDFINHLETYLGEFVGRLKQSKIDILCFKGERYHALVTDGMRQYAMDLPHERGGAQYLELMMFLDPSIEINEANRKEPQNAWLLEMLHHVACLPQETKGYLTLGEVIAEGMKESSASSSYDGVLLFTPMEQENVKFHRYADKEKTVYIYNVMPIFKEEMRFIEAHSSDQFINLMTKMGVSQVVQHERINIIRKMNEAQ